MYSMKVLSYNYNEIMKFEYYWQKNKTISLLKCVLDKKKKQTKKRWYLKDLTRIHGTRMRCSTNWDAWNKCIKNLSNICVKLTVS